MLPRKLQISKTANSDLAFRIGLVAWMMVILVSQPGCQLFRKFGTGTTQPAPVIFESPPAQPELIQVLQAKSERVRQLHGNISLSMDGMPKIKGTMQMERPDRIRIKAGLMGISELGVDVGSNSEQFWVWSRAAVGSQQPAIYFANHQEYRRSLQRAELPLEPQWIIDATGLIDFNDQDIHHGPFPGPDGLLKLHTIRQTPAGPITRVTLIDPESADVRQQAIYDSSNRRIAYSNSSQYRYYADEHVSLPHWIELHVFDRAGNEMKLVVEVGEYRINSLYGDPDKMWAMPRPEGIRAIDLTQVSR